MKQTSDLESPIMSHFAPCKECERDGSNCRFHGNGRAPACPDCHGSGVVHHRNGEITCPTCVSNDPDEFMPASWFCPF